MIPKKIHYVWFGGKPKTEKVKKCIASWRKYLPDYEIIEWNEKNFDISSVQFVREAIDSKMYAFASDFVRLWVIYNYGGIYLDTDVEVIRSYDKLLENKLFFGTEEVDSINSGLSFGAEPHNEIVKDLMNKYINRKFINLDGSFNLKTTNMIVTEYFVNRGYKLISKVQSIDGAVIYPKKYFAPMSWWSNQVKIEDVTYSIHWYDASWLGNAKKQKNMKWIVTTFKHYIVLVIRRLFGYFAYDAIKRNILRKK